MNHIPCGDFAWHLWTGILSKQNGSYTWINITEVQLLWPVPFEEVPCMVVTNLDLGNAETPKLIWIGSIEKKFLSCLIKTQGPCPKMITPGMLVPSMASFLVKNWKGGTSYISTMVVATYPTLGSSEKHRLKSAGLKEDMLVLSRVHSKKKSEFQSQWLKSLR